MSDGEMRSALCKVVNSLIAHENVDEVEQLLEHLHDKLLESPYSLNSLVYGGLAHELQNPCARKEQEVLLTLREELSGHTSNYHSFALKMDFLTLLTEEARETYRDLQILLEAVARQAREWPDAGMSEVVESLTESLYSRCYGGDPPVTIAELLLGQACHVLLSLPSDCTDRFGIETSRYSTVFPEPESAPVEPHLQYVQRLLLQLAGDSILFVDIQLLPEGYVLSCR
ncbi:MAG: hypothetical protein MUF84_09775 [Anaerolineae bacterium]|nr:hypothetical protein [Anaerolineae bacterium]